MVTNSELGKGHYFIGHGVGMGLKSLVHFQDLLYIGSRTLPSCTFISHYYIYIKINVGETSKWVHSQLGSGTEIYVCSLYLPPHLLSSIESRPAANKTQISAILSCLKSKPMNKAYLCSIQRTERTDFCSKKRHGTLSPPFPRGVLFHHGVISQPICSLLAMLSGV